MDNIYKYRLFLKTIETGNITRTAEAFFVSQSAVSQQLKQLEDFFGKALFYKDKTLKLTAFGHSIHGEIQQLISYYSNKENHIKQLSESENQSFSIVGKTIFLSTIVSSFIEAFNLKLRSIKNVSNHKICEAIQNGEAQLGFGEKEEGFSDIEFHEVLKIPIVPIIKSDHPLAKEKNLSFRDLLGESMILYEDSTQIGKKLQSFFIEENAYPKEIIHANHSTLIRQLVEQGRGIGFVYRHTITKAKGSPYKILKLVDFDFVKPYQMIINRSFLSEEQLAIIEACKKYFKANKNKLINL